MMRRISRVPVAVRLATISLALCFGAFAVFSIVAQPAPAGREDNKRLQPASAFQNIRDPKARSAAIFREVGKVLNHPRCVNCHPRGDIPLQGDNSRLHQPPVVRGPDGFGVAGMECGSCHGDRNFEPARVPGAPHWHLAPRSTGWGGKSLAEICAQIKDPRRNGGKTIREIVAHMHDDKLIKWAWAPGKGRTPAPGSWKRFNELIAAWAAAGAHCPAK
jgi:hypothetical protein